MSDKLVMVSAIAHRASAAIFLATALGVPVSTTHTITGGIVGVGAVNRPGSVRRGIAADHLGMGVHETDVGWVRSCIVLVLTLAWSLTLAD